MKDHRELDQLAKLLGIELPEEGQLEIQNLGCDGDGPSGGVLRLKW